MRESVSTKAGWQAVVRWVRQEREAQARDRMLAAHRQAREQELEWRAQRHEVWGTKQDGKLMAAQSFAQQKVREVVDHDGPVQEAGVVGGGWTRGNTRLMSQGADYGKVAEAGGGSARGGPRTGPLAMAGSLRGRPGCLHKTANSMGYGRRQTLRSVA